jgi:hypothetical protein
MGKPWFRVKRYGFGAGVPCSWEGWALLAAFLIIVIASAVMFTDREPLLHFGVVVVSTAIVIVVSWCKSDGPWKWRWGQD